MNPIIQDWKRINQVDISDLSSSRKILHQAVQLVAAFPRNILLADPTDESASLLWNEKVGGLQSNATEDAISVALSFVDFKFLILQHEHIIDELSMEGKSVNEGLEWLRSEANQLSFKGDQINLDLPYQIEDYDYSKALSKNPDSLKVFSAIFSNSNHILQANVGKWKNAYEVRCWPHHFDIATLIPLAYNHAGDLSQSIGVGMSPGDDEISEPYVYVNTWPNVSYDKLSKHALENGHWNKEGWSGAILKYTDFVKGDQKSMVQSFIKTVMQILKNQ